MEIIYILINIYSCKENTQGKFASTKLYAKQIVKKSTFYLSLTEKIMDILEIETVKWPESCKRKMWEI